MRILLISCFFFCVLVVPNAADAGHPLQLHSGNRVEILSMGQINFSKDVPALMLKYQTALNVDDKSSLRREVDEIWPRFVNDVEKAKVTSAIISASEAPAGSIVSSNRGYNFIFKKIDNKWCLQGPSDKENPPTQLTEPAVAQFIKLWDSTASDLNVEGTLLYLTPDWTCAFSEPGPDGKMQTQTIDWKKLQSVGHAMFASITDYKYSRNNTQIQVAPDGKSATVASKVTEMFTTKDGKSITTVSETSDVLQLENGQTLVKSSQQKLLEKK
jgi:hypothetical protein